MNIGLLMINGENDILPAVLKTHCEIVDVFYVLDGTIPNDESRRICEATGKCGGYITDAELPRPRFSEKPVCGWRQAIYEMAVADHGWDHWFLVLHGDEIWTQHPDQIIQPGVDGYVMLLPFYFPRDGEPWDYGQHPLEQLHWNLAPGFPEFRMFHGGPNVRYLEGQTFNTRPEGIERTVVCDAPIRHYLYRSPSVQRVRAHQHQETQFDPDNYQHITDHDAVYWTGDRIAEYMSKQWFPLLRYDNQVVLTAGEDMSHA